MLRMVCSNCGAPCASGGTPFGGVDYWLTCECRNLTVFEPGGRMGGGDEYGPYPVTAEEYRNIKKHQNDRA